MIAARVIADVGTAVVAIFMNDLGPRLVGWYVWSDRAIWILLMSFASAGRMIRVVGRILVARAWSMVKCRCSYSNGSDSACQEYVVIQLSSQLR